MKMMARYAVLAFLFSTVQIAYGQPASPAPLTAGPGLEPAASPAAAEPAPAAVAPSLPQAVQPCVPAEAAPLPATRPGQAGYKSPGTAKILAIGSTLVAWGVFGVGIAAIDRAETTGTVLALTGVTAAMIAPSAGHFYAGERRGPLWRSALRGAAASVAVYGLLSSIDFSGSDEGGMSGLFYVGVGVTAGLGLYDWLDAGDSAERANQRRARSAKVVTAAPPVTSGGGGLSLVGTF